MTLAILLITYYTSYYIHIPIVLYHQAHKFLFCSNSSRRNKVMHISNLGILFIQPAAVPIIVITTIKTDKRNRFPTAVCNVYVYKYYIINKRTQAYDIISFYILLAIHLTHFKQFIFHIYR